MKISINLIDFSPICFAQYYGHVIKDDMLETEADKIILFKHSVLNKIGDLTSKLRANETILAVDYGSWRTDFFKYYKARRKAKKVKDSATYEIIDRCIAALEKDIINLNYKVIKVEKAEADDVIGVLATRFEKDENIERVNIISGDKDFQQLTSNKIKLYSHTDNAFITCADKDVFMTKMKLRGDDGDDVPNVLSDDDTFVNENKKQKQCGDVKIAEILTEGIEVICKRDAIFDKNYTRNKKMVVLSEEFIPANIWSGINDEYDRVSKGFTRKNAILIANYFGKIGLNGLMSKANNFI